jgi:hypothetical protein
MGVALAVIRVGCLAGEPVCVAADSEAATFDVLDMRIAKHQSRRTVRLDKDTAIVAMRCDATLTLTLKLASTLTLKPTHIDPH